MIGYRAPIVGADEFPANIHLPPLSRPPEYWIEYGHQQRLVLDGYLVSSEGNVASTRTPLQNAAGQLYDTVFQEAINPVFVAAYNTRLLKDAPLLTERYENTTNSNEIRVLGLRVAKHHCRFIRAETSRVWETGYNHVRIETRIEVSKRPYYEDLPNTGDYAAESNSAGAGMAVQTDAHGRVVPPPARLKRDGTADALSPASQASAKADRVRSYLLLEPIEYKMTGPLREGLPF